MVYVTSFQSVSCRQMTLEELLFPGDLHFPVRNADGTNTRTVRYDHLPENPGFTVNVSRLLRVLQQFNTTYAALGALPRESLYHTFYVPKKSGRGYRRIDAPCPELMTALRELKRILEEDFHAMYHTSAFAYIKNRSTVDAVKRHQTNGSKWFGKFDLSNFFGNTTMDFVLRQFSMIFPFSEVMKLESGASALQTALGLAFLNGGLPQGTPVSPLITNIMMIPIDFHLSNGFRDFQGRSFVYTRYADDFIVSSCRDFDCGAVQEYIRDTLASFRAPFSLNTEKTRYGSSSGRNFNLGLMLTADNRITVGRKKKRQFLAMLSSFVLDTRSGNPWPLEDVQVLEGHRNYFRMVEGEAIDAMVRHVGEKYGVDIVKMIKQQLRPGS